MSQQHPSHTSVQQAAMAKYQGRAPTPADLIDIIWQTQRAQEEARRAQLEAAQKQQQAAAQQAQLQQQHQAGGAGGVQALPAVCQAGLVNPAPGGLHFRPGNCRRLGLLPKCAVPTDVAPMLQGTVTQGTAGLMGQQLPTQQHAMPPGSMPPPTTSMQVCRHPGCPVSVSPVCLSQRGDLPSSLS